jgi:carboxypeptidase family protein
LPVDARSVKIVGVRFVARSKQEDSVSGWFIQGRPRTIIGSRVFILLCGVLSIAAAAQLNAQTLNGTVRDSMVGAPVPGAVITLLDSTRAVLARSLSDQNGVFHLPAVATGRVVRLVRIGFEPREVVVGRGRDATVPFAITMLRLPNLLSAVRVRDRSPCDDRPDAATAFALWDQARAALLNSVVASQTDPPRVDRLHFERIPDDQGRPVAQAITVDAGALTTRPFSAARSAGAFVDSGFATAVGPDGSRTYFAPDADILMDDLFLRNYCLSIAERRSKSANDEGVAFRPLRKHRGHVDVEGAVWVDTTSRAVKAIEFRYVGLDRDAESLAPGGEITFREMPHGAVAVQQWSLRLPAMGLDTEYLRAANPGARQSRPIVKAVLYRKEFGGKLESARWTDGTIWTANDLGSLRARLTHTNGSPAAGLRLSLVQSPYSAVTDSNGIAVLYDVLPGPYRAELLDSALSRVGIAVESGIRFVVDSMHPTAIALTVPNMDTLIAHACRADTRTSSALQLIAGHLFSLDGKPVADAKVALIEAPPDSADHTPPPLTTTTDSTGRYQVCRSERSAPFLLTATLAGSRFATLQDSLPAATRVRALDLHQDAHGPGITVLRKAGPPR